MIISSAPLRITLGGGGTDLQSYYSKYGGFLIAAGINRYCTIMATKRFYHDMRLSYTQMEIVDSIDKIEHRLFRECLRAVGIDRNIELHSTADVPANSGLGSSSCFTVALLNALHSYKGDFITRKQLAEEACHIEIDILGEPIGKQDHYMAVFGGFTCLTFDKNGDVEVEHLRLHEETYDLLQDNLVFFFTGQERSASEILMEQDNKTKNNDTDMSEALHQIKEIGLKARKCLECGDVDTFGDLLHIHWESKKKRSFKMTNPFIDECYDVARKNGALGGKLIGAGGGGFLMFYCPNGSKPKITESLSKMGLRRERFQFDWGGVKIMLNTRRMSPYY